MSGQSRKIRRNKQKRAKKELQKKLGLFDKLGDKCLVCQEPFDKTSKEQVNEWSVVVRKAEGVVRLYCPGCWGKAHKFVEHLKEQNDN